MMKKRIMQLIGVSVCLLVFVCLFAGCRGEEELILFSGEKGSAQVTGDNPAGKDMDHEGLSEEEQDGADLTARLGEDSGGAEDCSTEEIIVYLCGAVKRPGVYRLKSGSRINDAVEAAGGLAEDAAASGVNLAAKLTDEEMIYVPTEEQNRQDSTKETYAENNTSLIDINTADVRTLCSLPGIGESRARDIITYREKNGAFRKKEDIMKVSGIKEGLYDRISDLIFVK